MSLEIKDEMISALVDGQLTTDEARLVREAILADPEKRALYEKLSSLQKVFEQGIAELGTDRFASNLAQQLRARALAVRHQSTPSDILTVSKSEKSIFDRVIQPFLELRIAATLLLGMFSGGFTIHQVSVAQRDQLTTQIALLEEEAVIQNEKLSAMVSEIEMAMPLLNHDKFDSPVAFLSQHDPLVSTLPETPVIYEMLGKQIIFGQDAESRRRALDASNTEYAKDLRDSMAEQHRNYKKALDLLRSLTAGKSVEELGLLSESKRLLKGAFDKGHYGAGVVLAEIVSPNQANEIYRELLQRNK